MTPTKRTFTGGFYAHGGITVAYIVTQRPYDFVGVNAAMGRAKAAPAEPYGEVKLKLHEDERYPEDQCFVILPAARHISRRHFEQLVRTLFPGCSWNTKWITNIRDMRMVMALIGREILERE